MNDINIIVVLVLLILVVYFYVGFSKKGLSYFEKYIKLILIFLFINILEDFIKLLLFSFWFFGNILVDELVVVVFVFLVFLVVFILVMFFGLFISGI